MIYVLGFVPPCRVLNSSMLKHFPRRKPLVTIFFSGGGGEVGPPVYLRVIFPDSLMPRATTYCPPIILHGPKLSLECATESIASKLQNLPVGHYTASCP